MPPLDQPVCRNKRLQILNFINYLKSKNDQEKKGTAQQQRLAKEKEKRDMKKQQESSSVREFQLEKRCLAKAKRLREESPSSRGSRVEQKTY